MISTTRDPIVLQQFFGEGEALEKAFDPSLPPESGPTLALLSRQRLKCDWRGELLKTLFVCSLPMLLAACQPQAVDFAQIGRVGSHPGAQTKAAEAHTKRVMVREDGHAPTPRGLPPSAMAMTTYGEVTLKGWVHSLGALDESLSARFEAGAFRLVSPARDIYRLDLVMKRVWQGEPASIDLTPGGSPGVFVGVLPRLRMNIQVRCVPQGPTAECNPLRQSTILIWPFGTDAAETPRAAFLQQGAAVSGRISGNFTPDFDSDVAGRLTLITNLDEAAGKRVELGIDLKSKYGTLVFVAHAGENRWHLDTAQSNSVYRWRFGVSKSSPVIERPLNPKKLQLPLVENSLLFQLATGSLDLTIQRN